MPWFEVETEYVWRGRSMCGRHHIEAADRDAAQQTALTALSRHLRGVQLRRIEVRDMPAAPTVRTAVQLDLDLDN